MALARHFREAEGLSIAQIAERLGRSPATVKAYFSDPTGEKARAVTARYIDVLLRLRRRRGNRRQQPREQVDGIQRDRRAPRLRPAVHEPHQSGAALVRGHLGQAASAAARLGGLNSEPSGTSVKTAGHPTRVRVPSSTSAWSYQQRRVSHHCYLVGGKARRPLFFCALAVDPARAIATAGGLGLAKRTQEAGSGHRPVMRSAR